MKNAEPWLQGDTFDAVMNYRFTRAIKNYVVDINQFVLKLKQVNYS